MTFNLTPEPIEAAAKVMALAHGVRFDVVPEWLEPYKEDARAALVAAAGAGLLAEAWTERDALTLRMQDALDCELGEYDDYQGGGACCFEHECDMIDPGRCAVADAIAEKLLPLFATAAPMQVDEAKLTTLIMGKTATVEAKDIAEWLRGGAISKAEPGTDLPGVDDGRSLLGEPPYMNVSAARPEWRFPDVSAIMLAGFAGAISAEPQEFTGARIELLDDGCTLRLTPMEGGAQ